MVFTERIEAGSAYVLDGKEKIASVSRTVRLLSAKIVFSKAGRTAIGLWEGRRNMVVPVNQTASIIY